MVVRMPAKRPPALDVEGSPARRLSLAEHVCLALIAEDDTHGWALGGLMASDGNIGRVWSLSRPLTYRAIDGLVDTDMIERTPTAVATGRDRSLLTATPLGRDVCHAWLDTPVEHLRDVRTELLVKLTLRTRIGASNDSLLVAQRAAFAPAIDTLTTRTDTDVVDIWRREHARAVRRFLNEAIHPTDASMASSAAPRPEMRLSARNQLNATVTAVKRGELMAGIKAVLGDGQTLTATITQEATDDLDIAPGDRVVLIVKATEVMVAKAP